MFGSTVPSSSPAPWKTAFPRGVDGDARKRFVRHYPAECSPRGRQHKPAPLPHAAACRPTFKRRVRVTERAPPDRVRCPPQVPRHVLRELDWPQTPAQPGRVPEFTQDAFDSELRRMLDADRRAGRRSSRIVARDLHRNVVGGSQPHRVPMACEAMWQLWRQQGSVEDNIIQTTESGQSSTIEIQFAL